MRNISFMLTTPQVIDGSKTQTRRVNWKSVKVGEVLQGVEKSQGLKKGERIKPIRKVRVVAVRRERLDAITPEDVVAEGFPDMTPAEFVAFFCSTHATDPIYSRYPAWRKRSERVKVPSRKFRPDDEVTVITFEYVDE